jgi:hypothetical protein
MGEGSLTPWEAHSVGGGEAEEGVAAPELPV